MGVKDGISKKSGSWFPMATSASGRGERTPRPMARKYLHGERSKTRSSAVACTSCAMPWPSARRTVPSSRPRSEQPSWHAGRLEEHWTKLIEAFQPRHPKLDRLAANTLHQSATKRSAEQMSSVFSLTRPRSDASSAHLCAERAYHHGPGENRRPVNRLNTQGWISIDSQTIKTTESGGKKTKGRKRHIVTDTLGFMVGLVVHSAGIQDRDGAPEVLKSIRYSHPNLRHIFADGGYAGPKLRDALEGIGDWTIQIVKRFDTAEGFEVIPRRWVVERTFAWLNRCRRLAKDWEKSIASSQAWILVAHIRTLTRKIARHCNHA